MPRGPEIEMAGVVPETIIGSDQTSMIMVKRGEGLPRFVCYFGMGNPDESFPNNTPRLPNISSLLTGSRESLGIFAVFNTQPLSSDQVRKTKPEDFLSSETVVHFIQSLVSAAGSLSGKKVPLSVESYSGCLFLAVLSVCLAYPNDSNSRKFFKALNDVAERVVILAPAISVTQYSNKDLATLRRLAMGESKNPIDRLRLEAWLVKEMFVTAQRGHILPHNPSVMKMQFLSRARQLVLFETVFNSCGRGFEKPDGLLMPKILVVHHSGDVFLDHDVNKRALAPLIEAGIIEFKTAADGFCGPEFHWLYGDERNIEPLRRVCDF